MAIMLVWLFDFSGLSCTAWGASQLVVIPGDKAFMKQNAKCLKPLAPGPRVLTHELPCCSLTHRDIIRDSGQKNNTSLFSLELPNKTLGLVHDKCLFLKKTSVFRITREEENVDVNSCLILKCKCSQFLLQRISKHLYFLIWNSSGWW